MACAVIVTACASTRIEVAVPPPSPTVTTPTLVAATPTVTTPAPRSTAEPTSAPVPTPTPAAVVPGLGRLIGDNFAPLVGKRVGVIANATSTFEGQHIIDLLAAAPDVDLVAAFAPEHGIRGTADAGAQVADETDPVTGIPIVSLYGNNRAPTPASLADLDVLVYDLQDVGARYYTYISTLGLAMQAAADAGVEFVVLDRPNPLGGERVAGFTREPELESFVSQYPIPSVYGLTAGELAAAIAGERWLRGLDALDLTVVPVANWSRTMRWNETGLAWVAPSPGLPTATSALVYPATVLFEATSLSFGKGTTTPFELVGAPWLDGAALAAGLNAHDLPGVQFEAITFTPSADLAPNPRHGGEEVGGVALRVTDPASFDPVAAGVYLLSMVQQQATAAGRSSIIDRPDFFDLLAGTTRLRVEVTNEIPADAIVAGWADDRDAFVAVHNRYRRY